MSAINSVLKCHQCHPMTLSKAEGPCLPEQAHMRGRKEGSCRSQQSWEPPTMVTPHHDRTTTGPRAPSVFHHTQNLTLIPQLLLKAVTRQTFLKGGPESIPITLLSMDAEELPNSARWREGNPGPRAHMNKHMTPAFGPCVFPYIHVTYRHYENPKPE